MVIKKAEMFFLLLFWGLMVNVAGESIAIAIENGRNSDEVYSRGGSVSVVRCDWNNWPDKCTRESLLRIKVYPDSENFYSEDLDNFEQFLRNNKKIKYICLTSPDGYGDLKRYHFGLKKLTSLIRGVDSSIRIGIGFPGLKGGKLKGAVEPLLSGDITAYFNAFAADACEKSLIDFIKVKAPVLRIWEYCSLENGSAEEKLMDLKPFGKSGITLILLNMNGNSYSEKSLKQMSRYINMELIDSGDVVEVGLPENRQQRASVYYKKDGVTAFIYLKVDKPGSVDFKIAEGIYRRAIVHNINVNSKESIDLTPVMRYFSAELLPSSYFVQLIPAKKKIPGNRHQVGVTGVYEPSVEEIIAGVRSHNAVQKRKLKSFTADMSASYHLKISDLNETFDLMIKGPVYSERGKPYDWVQKEFFLNGIKWKSKKAPKIPLLQPEKVNVVPLDIDLTENYVYTKAGSGKVEGKEVWIVDFKPVKGRENDSVYKGRLWIQKESYICLRKRMVQLNLTGSALSNTETQYMQNVNGVWLPVTVKGHQAFLTGGRVTNIEKKVVLEKLSINPENFSGLKKEAMDSDYRILRDTDKGFRYLVKNKKSGKRTVEWKSGRSQISAVFGGFYDSSFAFPVPLAGINYLDFDFQGKGRQVNVLFGGALLSAIYSDPSFLGTKIDVGGSLFAIAFPSRNRIYRNSKEIQHETVKDWPLRAHLNFGFPLGHNMKFSTFLFGHYNKYSKHKDTADDYIVPKSSLTYGARCRLNYFFKGFDLSLWGVWGRRSRWSYWGEPGNSEYDPAQRDFFRWRLSLSKDFNFSNFRQFKLKAVWLDGKDLDRFSAYRFGFFNELKMSGFNSGTIRAEKAFMLNLSYGYKISRMLGIEVKYDSLLLTNKYEGHKDRYFSGVAVAGTTAVPLWNNMLLRFEVGMPVVSHGIKGFVVYFMLLKMF